MKQKFVLLSVILLSVGSLLFPSSAFSENFTAPESNSTEIAIPEVNTSKDLKKNSSTNDKKPNLSHIPSDLSKYEKFEKMKEKFEKMKEKGDKDKKLRVIISLDAGFTPEGKLDFTKVKEQKDKIRQYQESILGELDSYNATQIHEFKHVPFMAMVVDKNALERLEADPMVASITEDILHHPTLAQSVPLIGAPAAWTSDYSGQGQAVAILDSGVEKGHSAFAGGKVISEACYSTTFPDDNATSVCPGGIAESTATNSALPCTVNGCDHGTHVAGIAAGNDATIQGVAPDADVIAIQVFSVLEPNVAFCGSTQPCIGAYTTDIIKGLERVLELSSSTDISSVNLSLGFGAWSDEELCDTQNSGLTIAVDNLKSAGIATVASSGNNFSPTTIGSPACIPNVVSVGSTNDFIPEAVSSFSNSAIFLDLLAPGQVITSSVPTGYSTKQGTSMAAPHVAGAFAVLKSFDSAITVDNALNALTNTGVPILDSRNGFTFPRIQVDSAVNSLIPKTVISFEDFESGFTTWINTSGDNNDCWRRDSAGTPTTNTGPSTGADGTTFYVFYESSNGCSPGTGQQALLAGPTIDFTAFNSVEVTFWRHMWDGFGADGMGRLALEIEDSPGSGTFTEVWFQQGNQGDQWDQFTVDLSTEDNTGLRQLRFVATEVVAGIQSDMAVDEILIQGNSV